jgi:GTPase SAR1 family protein
MIFGQWLLKNCKNKNVLYINSITIHIAVASGGFGSERTVIFLGEKSSGKSSLICKFLDEPVKDDMKETTALDYRYGIRTKDEKKQKFNIYELGGGRILSSLL